MTFWLLAGMLLYYLHVFLPSLYLIPRIGVPAYAGARDADPEPKPVHGRAIRAVDNFRENIAVFLALGIMAMVIPDADMARAELGAGLFVISRAIFLPLYLMAAPYLRSVAYTVGFVGQILMALALL